ncbi:protein mono-ADP-ribosyltransferase PARP6 isoform X2 [Harpia harpyja]|uniref:protein mono-ADP-ribosyltransferase PARP6 isoform X2 n=1 Tax=Harpia harpyja TaxID=202280 RepID=UPI0022B1B7A3|nr:protein mono-ADP-ribosyltransferase PARP6 isoform X2 [Harpia harpyja]
MDLKGQYWTDDDSDGDNESEEFLYGVQGTCAADLYRHPQLDADIEAVKEIYSENAVAVREYGTIDDVDIDLHVNIGFLDEEVATAWKVLRTEPIVLRLRFSLSQYLDGPEPSIEVFQPSNKEGFGLGLQLKKILGMFTSQQWKHLSNDFLKTQQEKRHSWFKTSGTIKKFRAGLSIFSPIPKSPSFPVIQDSVLKGKLGIPEARVNRLMNRSISCTVKNPKVEVFGYPPSSTQAGVAPFNILVGGHCKNVPTLEYGFLVQIMKYAEQRIPTLNEYCVVCDEQHVFQNGSMLKPAVCTRELCVFSFYTLGVMSGAAEEVATGAEVVDLLVAMCRAALESPRKSIIFEPYPSVVDPNDPKTLAFNPKKKNYERLQKALDSVMSIREMTQGSYLEIKKQMDKLDPLAHPLLQWIISSNRSHIVKLPLSRLKFMHTSHQFLLLSSPPAKEARFRTAKKLYGSTFAFHGSHIENWHSILRNGLVNASYTKLQLHGAAYGKGIYLSPISSISFGYSGMGKGQHRMPSKDELVQRYNRMNTIPQTRSIQSRFLQSRNLNCIALCEALSPSSHHLQGPAETRQHLGLPCLGPRLHPLLLCVRRWPSGRRQYQYSGPQNPEGDNACDRDSGVHKLSGGRDTSPPPGTPPGAEQRPPGEAGEKDERVLSLPGRADTGADAGSSTLYIGVKHPVSTRRVQRSLVPSPSRSPVSPTLWQRGEGAAGAGVAGGRPSWHWQ